MFVEEFALSWNNFSNLLLELINISHAHPSRNCLFRGGYGWGALGKTVILRAKTVIQFYQLLGRSNCIASPVKEKVESRKCFCHFMNVLLYCFYQNGEKTFKHTRFRGKTVDLSWPSSFPMKRLVLHLLSIFFMLYLKTYFISDRRQILKIIAYLVYLVTFSILCTAFFLRVKWSKCEMHLYII